jgi:hypothetical protein
MQSNLLSQVKLRPTKTEDRSAPLLKGDIDQVDVNKYHNAVLDLNLESWIDLIKEETFPTQFYPLTPANAKTFMKAYEQLQIEKRPQLTDEIKLEIETIAEGLQQVIDNVRSNGPDAAPDEHVFVKTSCRSAKDTTIYDTNFRSLYRTHLNSQGRDPFNENDQLRALLEAAVEILKVRSATRLLFDVFCTSERVYQDLSLALEHPDRFEQHFIVRKWADIDPGMEFRGFFFNGKLNALSQYNHLVFYPEVVEKKDEILNKIIDFFETKVKPKLAKRDFKDGYVVDFAITSATSSSSSTSTTSSSLGDVWVIELNPFVYSTDGCLFSWKAERNILENGPFEFRIRTQPLVGAKSSLAMHWRDVVESESKEMKKITGQ